MSHGLKNSRRAELIEQGNCHGDGRGQAETDSLTPHDHMRELTAVLASGIQRLRAIHSALPEWAQSPADSSPIGLDHGQQLALMEPGLQPESEELDEVD